MITKELRKELNWGALEKDLRALRDEFPALAEAPIIEQTAEGRDTHVHLRGDWKTFGIGVEPGALAVLPPLKLNNQAPRKALAEWLVSRENPLTARVTVNRIWQEYFGEGLVATAEDFGARAEKPDYMGLLDWLARELMDNDWRLKQIHKTIVMSATYRQASVDRPDLRSMDPKNRLFARQVRLRLPAELIRDSALTASGLLNEVVGGPSIRPPLPDGVTSLGYANSLDWKESTGGDRYRRGLYIHFQRTAPYPQLVGFDASERAVTECQRERSNTPLQALNLLNDPVFVEAARGLAVRVLRKEGDFADRLDYAYRLGLSRSPTPDEVEIATAYYSRQLDIFEADPAAAAAFMPVEVPGATRAEAAAWAGLGSVTFNLDEFITRE